MKMLERENLRVLPLALLGLARGLGELVLHELKATNQPIERQAANITYYATPAEEAANDGTN